MPVIIPPDPAAEINRLHDEVLRSSRTTLAKAIRIGELLTRQKAAMSHGTFQKWIWSALPFCDRTARSYMRLFENRERLKTETISDLGEAYSLLREAKPQAKRKAPTAADDAPLPQVTLNLSAEELEKWDELLPIVVSKFPAGSVNGAILAALEFAKENA